MSDWDVISEKAGGTQSFGDVRRSLRRCFICDTTDIHWSSSQFYNTQVNCRC